VAYGLTASRKARRPIRQVALVLLVADGETEVRLRASAVDALAALRREERDDVVAGLDRGDTVADLLDDSSALVSEHRRRVARRIGARGGVEIGVAHTAGDETHERLPGPGLGEIDLLDGERLPELLEHRRANPHRTARSSPIAPMTRGSYRSMSNGHGWGTRPFEVVPY
jgi:hypothetical protein